MRQIGDKVMALRPLTPYYSGYGGNPKVTIPVGTIGVVGDVNCPPVKTITNTVGNHVTGPSFDCVDFNLPGVFSGGAKHKNCTWRVSVFPAKRPNKPFVRKVK